MVGFLRQAPLFLTSKVRLHCDCLPGLGTEPGFFGLFLTSKVRLHCDLSGDGTYSIGAVLFLTSKVRLHCDQPGDDIGGYESQSFPDLKGQAPLRLAASGDDAVVGKLFLTSKVRLHCDSRVGTWMPSLSMLFLTSKVRLHCDDTPRQTVGVGVGSFS